MVRQNTNDVLSTLHLPVALLKNRLVNLPINNCYNSLHRLLFTDVELL